MIDLEPIAAAPRLARALEAACRPEPIMSPSEFAARHRRLKEGTTHRPGPWSNEVYPYLTSIMDCAAEVVARGKRGLVMIKSGQGGGSEAAINVLAWAKTSMPGPALYLISKDEVAREFGRDRFSHLIDTCEPLRRRALRGHAAGELIHVKRFVDGKLTIAGGRSVTNLESQPYRLVFIDEIDSLQDEIGGRGDVLTNALIRMDAFLGATFAMVFAHPTTAQRGAGKLYYEESDQRRAFTKCAHCGASMWLQWDHVRCLPATGETIDAASRRADRYHYIAPCCGCEISDSERYSMASASVQRSTLHPDLAARARWIGVHFSQLYMNNKSLEFLAGEWIRASADESKRRVFINKRMGDVFAVQAAETSIEDWRRLILVPRAPGDPDIYTLGQVPARAQFLTAGQDSGTTELHWSVWGWGHVRDRDGFPHLCGWLVDCGAVERASTPTIEAADLAVFDGLLYDRSFPRAGADGSDRLEVRMGLHDSGWCPVAAYEYCRHRIGRAVPSKGAAEDSESSAPVLRWGVAPEWRIGATRVSDPRLRIALLNTYAIKAELVGLLGRQFERPDGTTQRRLTLPPDTPEVFLEHAASERLTQDRGGRKLAWTHRGPNHYLDTAVMAMAAALNLAPFAGGTRDERIERQKEAAQSTERARLSERAAAPALRPLIVRAPVRRRY